MRRRSATVVIVIGVILIMAAVLVPRASSAPLTRAQARAAMASMQLREYPIGGAEGVASTAVERCWFSPNGWRSQFELTQNVKRERNSWICIERIKGNGDTGFIGDGEPIVGDYTYTFWRRVSGSCAHAKVGIVDWLLDKTLSFNVCRVR